MYKVFTADKDYVEYDPFEILKIDPVSTGLQGYLSVTVLT